MFRSSKEKQNKDNKKDNLTNSDKKLKEKDDFLFLGLIFATFIAGLIISIQSKKYNDLLYKINPNYYFPSLFEIIMNTTILTFILFILKLSFEKIFYHLNDKLLLEKYAKSEDEAYKNRYKKKLSIYGLKFIHYIILTIHSYFIYDKLDFFPKELFGHGNMKNLYSRGVHSFCFFERPNLFDFHYLLNLAYTFADLFCVVFIYDKQSDILVMAFHHFCTIILIAFSYYNHFDSIGCLIMYLHNFSDIFVYLGRTFLYAKLPLIMKKLITVSLLICFGYCRLFVYGKLIIGFFLYFNWEAYNINHAFKIALISLYILHCFWMYKICRIVYDSITKSTFDDSRKFVNISKNEEEEKNKKTE